MKIAPIKATMLVMFTGVVCQSALLAGCVQDTVLKLLLGIVLDLVVGPFLGDPAGDLFSPRFLP